MEKYFGNAYRGDPGVPHCDPAAFSNIWLGSVIFNALTWNSPYMSTLATQYNFHDQALIAEHYHWKKALEKGKSYEIMWNKINDRRARDSYYFNWPYYFK